MTFLSRPKRPHRPVAKVPRLEVLEDRTVPAPVTVGNLNDVVNGTTTNIAALVADPGADGISLREAMLAANQTPGADTITFQAGLHGVLQLAMGQMTISDPVTITGNGAARTILDAGQMSRFFDITATADDVTLDGLTLRNGRTTAAGERGGAIRFGSAGTLTVRNSTLIDNATTGLGAGGGAIASNAGPIVVNTSSLLGNFARGDTAPGGAIYADQDAVTILSSTLSGNYTWNNQSSGGAIHSRVGPVTVINSTLSGNATQRSSANGGAISSNTGAVTVRNSTIVFNEAGPSAGSMGGGIFSLSAPVVVHNSIVARNRDSGTAPDIRPAPDAMSDPFTVRHSLVGSNVGTGLAITGPSSPDADGNLVGGAGVNALDPMIGPLADNGGPTPTRALRPGSPALDRGNNALALDPLNNPLEADQRGPGFVRISGSVDMGAFEVQRPPSPSAPSQSARAVEVKVQRVKQRTRVEVRVDGALRRSFFPFGAHTGRVKVVRADVNGDGQLDVIASTAVNGRRRARRFIL